jgi:hypothetical protein
MLWERIEPLLTRRSGASAIRGASRSRNGSSYRESFHPHTEIGWEHLPQELGFGCGMTACRRLRAWQKPGCGSSRTSGCWPRFTSPVSSIGRERSRIKPCTSEKGDSQTGASRLSGRRGRQHHLLVEAGGVPLAWTPHGRQPQQRDTVCLPCSPCSTVYPGARWGRPIASAATVLAR